MYRENAVAARWMFRRNVPEKWEKKFPGPKAARNHYGPKKRIQAEKSLK